MNSIKTVIILVNKTVKVAIWPLCEHQFCKAKHFSNGMIHK